MGLLLFVAFGAGVVTVLSPCILPVLPIVLSSSVGTGRARPLGVIAGLIVSFSVFTLVVSQLIALLGLPAGTLRLGAVVILALLGLAMAIPAFALRLEMLLSRLSGLTQTNNRSGWWGGLLTGVILGVVWAPCAGPTLAVITTLAATQQVTLGAVLLVFAYALGAGVPLLGLTYGGRALLARLPALSRRTGRIQQGFGIAIIATALLMAFNVDAAVTAWATAVLPADWTTGLQAFESSPAVSAEIDRLNGQTGAPVTATATPSAPESAGVETIRLDNFGPAPELVGITHWINTEPLTLASLRGKVVLIDYWTYSCINCLRTLPYVTSWYEKYKEQGLVIIGVHSPEFAFEHDTPNVERAVQQLHILYPVAQDNDFLTWRAYHNRYWPAEYFIDAQGNLRHTHFGEGNYDESEMVIQELLAEAGRPVQASLTQGPVAAFAPDQTPETYIGTERQENFASPEPISPDHPQAYSVPAELPRHHFAVGGQWNFGGEYATVEQAGGVLRLHFVARDVYLVMTSDQLAPVEVSLLAPQTKNQSEDINAQGQILVNQSRLYHLVQLDSVQEGTLELRFEQPGVRAYAFTFGG